MDILAKVSIVPNGVAGCTQQDVELVASEIWVVSASAPQLPLQIEDASRPEKAEVFDVFYNIFVYVIIRNTLAGRRRVEYSS